MSKKKKIRQAHQDAFNTKQVFIKYAKWYGITLLIAVPFIMAFNYIMSNEVPGYSGIVSFFVSFALLLLACFIALIIFTKRDDKKREESTKEKERDPFAD